MGTIVCQTCDDIIEHFEYEKATVLYGICSSCQCQKEKEE